MVIEFKKEIKEDGLFKYTLKVGNKIRLDYKTEKEYTEVEFIDEHKGSVLDYAKEQNIFLKWD